MTGCPDLDFVPYLLHLLTAAAGRVAYLDSNRTAAMLESAGSIPSRSHGYTPPARRRIARIDGRSRSARRIKQLTTSYIRRLGDVANDPTVHGDIVRLAEVETVVEGQRAAALRHEPVDLIGLNRLENTARRLRIALGLDKPPAPRLLSLKELDLE
jgi:hypothetical protein